MPKAVKPKPSLLRAALLEKLTTVAPALSDSNVPILNHLWFTGDEVMAFSDAIAISVPHASPFRGALPGKLLIDFVKTITRDEVLFEQHENGVKLTAAGSSMRATFPMLPPEDFLFAWDDLPSGEASMSLTVDEHLRDAVKAVLRSVGKGGTYPETHGVVFIQTPSKIVLYGTDAATVTRALATGHKGGEHFRAILPTLFCQQLIKRPDENGELHVYANYAEYKSLDFHMFGRVRAAPDPLDFEKVIGRAMSPERLKASLIIPGQLSEMLERAYVLTKTDDKDARVMFTIDGGFLKIEAETARGNNTDLLKFVGHPNLVAKYKPGLLYDALGDFERIAMSDRALALINPTVLYLVASS